MNLARLQFYVLGLLWAMATPLYAIDLTRANEFLEVGQHDEAERSYKSAVDKDDIEACYQLSIFYEDVRGNDDQALQYFLQAAKGSHRLAQSQIVHLFVKAGQYDDANYFEKRAKAQGIPDLHYIGEDSDK